MGGHLLSLHNYAQASRIKHLTAAFYPPAASTIRRKSYNQQQVNKGNSTPHGINDAERAPSTAEEFERVAEEKSHQGFASQTVEKAQDGAGEAMSDNATPESVKESFKEPPGKGDFHKKE